MKLKYNEREYGEMIGKEFSECSVCQNGKFSVGAQNEHLPHPDTNGTC